MGYSHNNCGGGCILAGIRQWSGLLEDNPALFHYHEEKEQELIKYLQEKNRTVMTILKDRRGGTTKSLSLKQLREEIESGKRKSTDSWRESSCSCMSNLYLNT